MLSRFDRLAYHGQHLSFLINATVMQEAARIVSRAKRPQLSRDAIRILRERRAELHRTDLANVEAGMYPRELLFDIPVRRYLRELPRLVRDAPNVVRRMHDRNYKDIPDDVDRDRFPPYYRRTFHWQTDGYFSDHSAEIYELGVELLFRGTADVMRRMIIPPITKFAGDRSNLRVLDVACGTGRTLHQIGRANPKLRLHGADLSPAYIRRARRRLADIDEVTLAVENAEALPWADATFDIATSVYLFHELPRNARRNVARELYRITKPGGLVVLEDSAQLAESRQLETVLREFPAEFHEPFYADYLEDDLAALLAEAGFVDIETQAHLVAKVVVARKPA
ncbi:MAG TPA: class I SAM-dependent methyltransferase [Kofleriaceae bacterium]|jgi:ubiquinone/menaquinone biosynthesis C-methylase UbiE